LREWDVLVREVWLLEPGGAAVVEGIGVLIEIREV
jgi:hypothetical protein